MTGCPLGTTAHFWATGNSSSRTAAAKLWCGLAEVGQAAGRVLPGALETACSLTCVAHSWPQGHSSEIPNPIS